MKITTIIKLGLLSISFCVLGEAAHAVGKPDRVDVFVTSALSPLVCRSLGFDFDQTVLLEQTTENQHRSVFKDANGVPIYDRQRSGLFTTNTVDPPNGNTVEIVQNWVRTRYYTEGELDGRRTYNGHFETVYLNGAPVYSSNGQVNVENWNAGWAIPGYNVCDVGEANAVTTVTWDLASARGINDGVFATSCFRSEDWAVCQMLADGETHTPAEAPEWVCDTNNFEPAEDPSECE